MRAEEECEVMGRINVPMAVTAMPLPGGRVEISMTGLALLPRIVVAADAAERIAAVILHAVNRANGCA